jgi:uncharacterized protein (DUF427 family)
VRVQVTFNGEVIADTKDAITLDYLARGDVKMERLIRATSPDLLPIW